MKPRPVRRRSPIYVFTMTDLRVHDPDSRVHDGPICVFTMLRNPHGERKGPVELKRCSRTVTPYGACIAARARLASAPRDTSPFPHGSRPSTRVRNHGGPNASRLAFSATKRHTLGEWLRAATGFRPSSEPGGNAA